MQLDRHAVRHQALSIVEVFFREQIKRAGGDVGGRQALEAFRAGRRSIGRDAVAARRLAEQRRPAEIIGRIGPDEFPIHRRDIRAHGGAVVKHREDQLLVAEAVLAPVAHEQRQSRREAAAGAFPGHRDAACIDTERSGVFHGPGECAIGVLDIAWETGFWPEPVGGGDDDRIEHIGPLRAEWRGGIRRAENIAATVQMEDRRSGRRALLFPVGAHADIRVTRRAGHMHHLSQYRLRQGRQLRQHHAAHFPDLRQGLRRDVQRRERLQERQQFRIDEAA